MSVLAGLAVILAFWWVIDAIVRRPWYTRLHPGELPGVLAACLAGPVYRRRLRAALRARRSAAVSQALESHAAAPRMAAGTVTITAGVVSASAGPDCDCCGCEALRARARHDQAPVYVPGGVVRGGYRG